MAEFAETIGTQQSTISRYEAGQLVPSRSMLILLLLLANEDEKSAVAEALGVEDADRIANRYAGARRALFDLRAQSKKAKPGADTLSGFVEEAAAIASTGEPVDRSIVELLRLWREQKNKRQLRNAVAQMLPYFQFVATRK